MIFAIIVRISLQLYRVGKQVLVSYHPRINNWKRGPTDTLRLIPLCQGYHFHKHVTTDTSVFIIKNYKCGPTSFKYNMDSTGEPVVNKDESRSTDDKLI